ncbi:uncharacterized protein LY89DRAFT_642647 [Mollisia scopiformis]|uniref:Serine hydrolase domain-containing protein n=1 Tax=Mollisia scopiformis TaxID=149040 RepID=A0A194XIE8_MOLSC|nr:uncharacterized protein LY89DRAFT_642647 [Mollisia scopiformis]KUJ19542.1 hypothetical protein LY89DRAFT_642647 [Mollisia scopiformis]
MHFLCLHGIGTSNQVFEVQTAALRYELGDNHSYEFVEGTVPWQLAPEVSSMFNPKDSYHAYFDPESAPSAQQALDQLDDYVHTEGPFDGIIAFSQGAALAATYIIRKSKQSKPGNHNEMPIKCVVFLSSTALYDYELYFEKGQLRVLDADIDSELIQIPTVHIWGEQDNLRKDSERLSRLCAQATVFVHGGAHEVPGLGSNANVTGAVNAIRRGIREAQDLMSRGLDGRVEGNGVDAAE